MSSSSTVSTIVNSTTAFDGIFNNNTASSVNDSYTDNVEGFDKLEFPPYFKFTSMAVCIVILTFGVIGNVMVPIVIIRTKDMRNSTNIFLTNLSVADLLVLLICTPTVLVEVNSKPETWVLGENLCKIIPFVELTVAHASVLTILAITFERYYAICEPLRAGYVCTKARAFVICIIAWFIAALCASPMLVISKFDRAEYIDNTEVTVCWSLNDPFWIRAFFLSTISVFFLLPLAALAVLYIIIAKHLMANPGITASNSNSTALRYRRQVVLMLGTVVFTFFVCLLPYRALITWIILAPNEFQLLHLYGYDSYYKILSFCRFMVYLNSAINPILYNLMSSKFRDGFKKLCGIKGGCGVYMGRKGTVTTSATGVTGGTTGSQKNNIEQNRRSSILPEISRRKESINLISMDEEDSLIAKLCMTNNIIKLQESYV